MTDQEILREALDQFRIIREANQEQKDSWVKDVKFAYNLENGHWDESDVEDRINKGRPYLTSNKLAKFVSQVVNAERGSQDRNAVIPVDDKGDPEVAEIYNDLILDIEYQSSAEEIYSLAGEHAVAGGFGLWRIVTEYTDDGFDQEIKLKPIKNPLNVEIDPRWKWAFIREPILKSNFEKEYPSAEFKNFDESDYNDLWYDPDHIWIAECFKEVPYEKTIVETVNPETMQTEVYEITEENETEIRKKQILRERKLTSHKVMWYKITGAEILEKTEWAGKYIPLIEVVGHEINLEGKTYKMSLVKDAKDMNKMYDYWLTSMTEKYALAPKAPYMVTPQQISGFEDEWKQANKDNKPYLLYNPSNTGAPQRTPPPEINQAEMTMLNVAANDIRDILGKYEASSGMTSNERSGKAIMARAAQGDLVSFNFPDNLRRAKVWTKKILIDLIPKIYDNSRVVRLQNKDTQIKINFETLGKNMEKIKVNDLSRGRYDIRVDVQNNPSKRQQIASDILQAMQYAPAYADLLLPLLFTYMDTPGASVILPAIQQRQMQLNSQNQPQKSPQGVMNEGIQM